MQTKLQVFISSTFLDLKDERQAAVQAVLRAGHIPAGMELFTAADKSQWDIIKKWIDESDIYVLLLGGRYGSIEASSGLSYTELEFDYAVSQGKPFFSVVINERALEIKVRENGTEMMEKENPLKLKEFRLKVLTRMASEFSDLKDIKLAVMESVFQLQSEYALTGWVRSELVPDVKALTDELANLQRRCIDLSDENSRLRKSSESTLSSKTPEDKEFEEIFRIFQSNKISLRAIHHTFEKGTPDEISIITAFRAFKNSILLGPTNKAGIGEQDAWLYFNLCPLLQAHELLDNEKVAGVQYRRYAVTKKGARFYAWIDKLDYKTSQISASKSPSAPGVDKKSGAKSNKK